MKCTPLVLLVLQATSFACATTNGRYNGVASTRSPSQKYKVQKVRNVEDCQFGICKYVENYPAEKIERALKNHEDLHSFFDGPIVDTATQFSISINTRNNDDESIGGSLCATRNVEFVPQRMKDNLDADWIIANTDNFSQVLKTQICNHRGETTSECRPSIEHGYTSNCVQRYMNTKLLTYSEKKNVLKYKQFRIPSHCVCEYTEPDY